MKPHEPFTIYTTKLFATTTFLQNKIRYVHNFSHGMPAITSPPTHIKESIYVNAIFAKLVNSVELEKR